MNILFVGHDLAYARFYNAIELALRQRIELSSRHLYFRPSAWLYARLALRLPALSPSLTRLIGRWPDDSKADTGMLDLRFYPTSTDEDERRRFARLHGAYCRFIQNSLADSNFDVAVLPGEFRLFEQATISVLESARRPPQVIYFEAGPPGYVYFDRSGVNANASFAATGFSQLIANMESLTLAPSDIDTMFRRAARIGFLALDVAWLGLAKKTRGLLDLEEYWAATCNRLRAHLPTPAVPPVEPATMPPGSWVIFIGQVRNDVNHTHFGVTDAELEQHLIALLSGDPLLQLIWRDHPLEYSNDLFKSISAVFPNRVLRMRKMPLQRALASAEGVVTVNSNGGLEALAAGLPVRLLGRSYFAKLKGVCSDDVSFQIYRNRIRAQGPDEAIRTDAKRFLQDCFLPIDYRGENFFNAHLAAQVILSCKS